MILTSMLRLVTFGGLAVESGDGAAPPRPRPQRLAILAVLASAGDRGISRERMSALFWPDMDDDHARHSLRQALYALRQDLSADVIVPDAVLSLDRAVMTTDVHEFRTAVAAGNRASAAALATGPFLDGFSLAGMPEFERWVEAERTVLAADASRVLLALAKDSQAGGDIDAAVEWWRRLTTIDPLSGRFALGYLKALAARGDRAGALAFARSHENLVRRELESDADPEIRRLEAELRALPSPEIVRVAPAFSSPATVASAVSLPPNPMAVLPSGSPEQGGAPRPRKWKWRFIVGGVAATALVVLANVTLRPTKTPTFAVGMIHEEGVPDTLRIGGVLTDMLATNLARVAGLSVLANARLFELMRPGQDTLPAGYLDAARRAGATEILQGRLLAGPQWGLAMEIQRVDLTTGLVKGAYRIAANDRYALIDSMTAAIARDLRLGLPRGSVAEATTDSPVAYRLYEEGLRAYYQYDFAAALRLMQSALHEDSTFAMAAYFEALLIPGQGDEIPSRRRALRLAERAPERQRLTITADLLAANLDPAAVAVAESLTTRYPDDPRAFEKLSTSLWFHGDWRDAATAIERAIALDSASEPAERRNCRLCTDFVHLANIYLWWDSLPAAERTAQRFLRVRPGSHNAWNIFVRSAAARGDTGATQLYLRRVHETDPLATSQSYFLRYTTLAEDYDQAAREAQPLVESPRTNEADEGRWMASIALRNQGRLGEALALEHIRAVPNDLPEALIALERGDSRTAIAIFRARAGGNESTWPTGLQARHIAFSRALFGMALAAAGDTLAVRRLADTVEYWGQRSLYGRDRRAHHYLRGLLRVAARQDAEAVEEFRQAIHSPTHGFTRINYELGRALLRLDRPAEAVPIVRAALHGDIDGSNLYMTRTDLHELLAQAFDRLAMRDSAAVHYRAVTKAWQRADPLYHARRDRARAWLAAHLSARQQIDVPPQSQRVR